MLTISNVQTSDTTNEQTLQGIGITQAEREFVMERALSHIANRYVERVIKDAPTLSDAIEIAKKQCHMWGMAGPNFPRITGGPNGIKVVMPDEREGTVSYRELAQYARGDAVQQTLW